MNLGAAAVRGDNGLTYVLVLRAGLMESAVSFVRIAGLAGLLSCTIEALLSVANGHGIESKSMYLNLNCRSRIFRHIPVELTVVNPHDFELEAVCASVHSPHLVHMHDSAQGRSMSMVCAALGPNESRLVSFRLYAPEGSTVDSHTIVAKVMLLISV